MLIPREGSLLLAASGSLTIVCEPTVVTVAWNLILGMNHHIFGMSGAPLDPSRGVGTSLTAAVWPASPRLVLRAQWSMPRKIAAIGLNVS
jgi:hypothetical protein